MIPKHGRGGMANHKKIAFHNPAHDRTLNVVFALEFTKIPILPAVLYGCETWSLTLRYID
jgi:hypothetical protein